MYIVRPHPSSTHSPRDGSRPAVSSTDEYRRTARRLRHRYRNHPHRLHQALKRLATGETGDPSYAPSPIPTPAVDFAQAVAASMDGPFLRYSARQRLLAQAARIGISRFEANLLIAAVQHRLRARAANATPSPLPSRLARLFNSLCLALALQTVLITALWLLLR